MTLKFHDPVLRQLLDLSNQTLATLHISSPLFQYWPLNFRPFNFRMRVIYVVASLSDHAWINQQYLLLATSCLLARSVCLWRTPTTTSPSSRATPSSSPWERTRFPASPWDLSQRQTLTRGDLDRSVTQIHFILCGSACTYWWCSGGYSSVPNNRPNLIDVRGHWFIMHAALGGGGQVIVINFITAQGGQQGQKTTCLLNQWPLRAISVSTKTQVYVSW